MVRINLLGMPLLVPMRHWGCVIKGGVMLVLLSTLRQGLHSDLLHHCYITRLAYHLVFLSFGIMRDTHDSFDYDVESFICLGARYGQDPFEKKTTFHSFRV